MKEKKRFWHGTSDFKKVACDYCYVDKTLFIRDLLRNKNEVNLITRPRRFGKTLNMSMLQTFFEISKKDNSVYFRDKKIWKEGEEYTNEQGKYPVIFMSFKDARRDTWDETYDDIVEVIVDEFSRHDELAKSRKVKKTDLDNFKSICAETADSSTMSSAIQILTRMLHSHYGIEPIVLIDEYDAPIQAGYTNGYYSQAVSFIGDLFSKGLKDNSDMYFAVLTGILRVSKESIFSGLNNLEVFSILEEKGERNTVSRSPDEDERFMKYFGFTLDEVKELLECYDCSDKLDEVLEWYDGYDFGGTKIFNPLSVLKYIDSGCLAKEYWANTSGNDVIGELLQKASRATADKLSRFLQGDTISCTVNQNVLYANLEGDSQNIFSLLLFSGYLESVGRDDSDDNRYFLRIPNKEIRGVFETEIIDKLFAQSDAIKDIWGAVLSKDAGRLERKLRGYLMSSSSFHDEEKEIFYHGMWLGMSLYMSESYYVRSNGESGDGRFDLELCPKNERDPAIIFEFKSLKKGASEDELRASASDALAQIDRNRYATDLLDRGHSEIINVGVSFSGKNMAVAM